MAPARRFLLGFCLLCLTGAVVLAGDDGRRYREFGQFVSEGAFRGFSLPGTANRQHEKVLENWKKLYEKERPAHVETDRFLLFGTLDEKALKEAGVLLEKTYALAAKSLNMEGEAPWSGKLSVYLVGERGELTSLIRIVEKRRADEAEQGAGDIDGDFPHIIAGPPPSTINLSPEQQAGEQIAGTMLARKAGGAVPEWVRSAFGRATVLRCSAYKDLAAERRRVVTAINRKRNLKEVLGPSSLDVEETTVMRASLMDYLAYSGRTAKFMPFIKGFQPSEAMPEPKVEQALDAANLIPEKLHTVWANWVRMVK